MSDSERPDYLKLIRTPPEIRIESEPEELPHIPIRKSISEWAEWKGLNKGSLLTGILCLSIIVSAALLMIISGIMSLNYTM